MNREIKFRAWLQDEETMVYSNDQASTDSCEVWIFRDNNLVVQVQETIWREGGGETFERIEYVDCNHTVMQYTGLKDKNGKEIYEGDLVKTDSKAIMKVCYREDMCRFVLRFNDHSASSDLDNDLEVIGNIYDSPELLDIKKAQLSEPKVE